MVLGAEAVIVVGCEHRCRSRWMPSVASADMSVRW